LLAGIAWYRTSSGTSDFVRLWLAFSTGLMGWAFVGGLLWPRFSRPKFVEYERWLVWSTVLGVGVGSLRAAIETFVPAAARAAAAAHPTTDVFTRATDTVSRATFGMAMVGGVLFLSLWIGSSAGGWSRRRVKL
jgi:hypothetical protein